MTIQVAAIEALHALLLKELTARLRPEQFVLKGGVNLRLFFGSVRYSEDMDLDAAPEAHRSLKEAIQASLGSRDLVQRLRELGMTGVAYSGRPSKDSDATLRYKLQVLLHGGIRLPTRIEASFRNRCEGDTAVLEVVEEQIVRPYLRDEDEAFAVPHYPRTPALRQKTVALARRAAVQARDVFDLSVLARGRIEESDLQFLRKWIREEDLCKARDRALELGQPEFAGQVLEFISEEDRERLGDAWTEIQLFVADLIEAVLRVDPEGADR